MQLDRGAQTWVIEPSVEVHAGTYTVQHKTDRRYLDSYEDSWLVVPRQRRLSETQQWRIKPLGNRLYTIQQTSTNRFLDLYRYDDGNLLAVTRPEALNSYQEWIITPIRANEYRI